MHIIWVIGELWSVLSWTFFLALSPPYYYFFLAPLSEAVTFT